MQLLHTVLLLALHTLRALLYLARLALELSGLRRLPPPKPLRAARTRVPKHLAVVFRDARKGDEDMLVKSTGKVAEWCREEGIEELSVYDRAGILKTQHSALRLLLPTSSSSSSPSPAAPHTIELPLTPPSSSKPSPPSSVDGLSDTESPLTLHTTVFRRRTTKQGQDSAEKVKEVKVNVLSWSESKPLIARAALTLALRSRPPSAPSKPGVSVSDLDSILKTSFSSPSLLLIHPARPPTLSLLCPSTLLSLLVPPPLELDGFPPWHIDLSEMYYEPARWRPWARWWASGREGVEEEGVRQEEFLRALEQYEKAEMRKGR